MKDYILVLASWYPSKLDAFNGDFNERLVKSVSNHQNQIVVYVEINRKSKTNDLEVIVDNNIITYKVYFNYSRFNIFNLFYYLNLNYRITKKIFNEYGLPKLVHTYVFFPAGLISIYLKYRYKTKAILTEHWSIFNYRSKKYFDTYPWYIKFIYKRILNSFDLIIAVGADLAKSVDKYSPNVKKEIIPNVVNTNYFSFDLNVTQESYILKFLHVSDMGKHKNVISILNTMKAILLIGYNVHLNLVGKENKEVNDFLNSNSNLKDRISFLGEIPYNEVANQMRKSNVFILFSLYENMPCVILEALCCGLPVISSNVGGISEVINNENGLLVESQNEEQLKEAIIYMIQNFESYNRKFIAKKAQNSFSYEVIGQKVNNVYQSMV